MPQVLKAERKQRATRLRAAGEARVADYLAAQIGLTSHRVLMERPRMGRTEGFAEAMGFQTDHMSSVSIIEAQIVASDGRSVNAGECLVIIWPRY